MRLLNTHNFLFSAKVSSSLKQFLFLVGVLFVSFNGYSQVDVGFSTAAVSGEEASGTIPIFLVSGNVTSPSTVEINISSVTAVLGEDYTIASTIINIPIRNYGNNIPFDIGIDILDDFIAETDEVLELEIIAVSGNISNNVVGNQLSYTIINDDFAGVNVDTFVGTTTEDGGTAEFVFTLTSEPTDDVEIIINNHDTTETECIGPGFVTFTPSDWNTGVTLIVRGLDDAIYDGDQVDRLNTGNVVSSDPFYNVFRARDIPQIDVTNLDNEVPTVKIKATDVIAAENTPANATGLFTIDIGAPNPNNTALVVNYSISGIAKNGTDYTTIQESVSILSGEQMATVLIEPIDDAIVEGDEIVTLTLLPDAAYDIDSAPVNQAASITIADNDTGIIFLDIVTPAFIDEVVEGDNNGTFRIRLDKGKGEGVPLNISFTLSGTANVSNPNDDYDLLGVAVNVDQNMIVFQDEFIQFREIRVGALSDFLVEGDETIIMTLTGVDNPLFSIDPSSIQAIVTIIDNNICAGGDTAPPINNNSTSFCDTNSINLNDFVVDGAASAPSGSTLQWSTVPNPTSDTDLIATSVVSTSDIYYATYWDDSNNCSSPSSPVDIVFNTSPNIDIDDNASACNNPNNSFGPISVNLNLFSTGSDAGEWAFTTGPTNIDPNANNVVNFSNQTAGTYVYTYTTNTATGICSDQSFAVTINVDNCDPCSAGFVSPVLNPDTPTLFCDDIDVSLNDYVNDTPPAGTTLEWSNFSDIDEPGFRFLNANEIANPSSGTVFGFFWDSVNNCVSPAREITIVLNLSPVITNTTGGERCGSGSIDLTVTGNASESGQPPTFNWYASDDLTDTLILNSGTTFSTPSISTSTTFYVSATADNCTSDRVPVQADIFPIQFAGTPSNTSSCSDPDNGPTTVDLDDRLTGASAGVWTITSDPSNTLTIDDSNTVNFINRPDGDYVFTFTTTGAEGSCVNESATVTISVNDCDIDTDLDGLFDGVEAALGTDPNNEDTDGDLINDADEVGDDINNPIDTDEDGIIDALESNVLDQDSDGIVDQLDPANDNPCLPNRFNGVCDTDGDGISDLDEQNNGSDEDDPCSPNATADCDTPIDLEVLKSVDNENVTLNEQVVFTITVTNLSDRLVKDVLIGDLLESGFEYVEDNASLGTYDEQTGIWDIDEIEASQTITLEITVNVIADGVYTNTAELLQSFPIDATTANNSATVVLNVNIPEGVDLSIEKTADIANALVNDEVVFTIKVTNISIEGIVSQIEVSDVLDVNGFEYLEHSTDNGNYNINTGVWEIPTLDVNEEAILTITVLVPNLGTYSNTASIIGSIPVDSNSENNIATVNVNVSIPTPADVGVVFNQFSPNADGVNDTLKINLRDSETNFDVAIIYNIIIFDRYGNEVFEAQNKKDSEVWDGTYKGEEVPNGTYFYILNIDVGSGATVKKGWIQLIR